ncbi:hypothetical protein [Mesorhizobium loti]|uniref:hypothetical protein n=1 Tax=Rhizobium loti TaxID=381 RepID=UPI00047EAB53|nr:hypothetical protein [Mesorhizobium loti]
MTEIIESRKAIQAIESRLRPAAGLKKIQKYQYSIAGNTTLTLSDGFLAVQKCTGTLTIQTASPDGVIATIFFTNDNSQIVPPKLVGKNEQYRFYEASAPSTLQSAYLSALQSGSVQLLLTNDSVFSLEKA